MYTDSDILFVYSVLGYSNNKLRLIYLKYFNLFTESSTKGSYCMLIFDKHSYYVMQLFIEYC
jgi:hypothetical protein